MTLRSPVAAMLWENSRLTRAEVVQRIGMSLLLPAAVLAVKASTGPVDGGTMRFALLLLVMAHTPLWLTIAKLNGGRFMDGYQPAYPFYFLYSQPVRTFVLVAGPMAYLVALGMAAYLVSALALRVTFGYPFPLLPLAAVVGAFHVTQWAAQWATSSKIVQLVGSIVACLGIGILTVWRTRDWPAAPVDFGTADYALMAALAVGSLGLTVAGVARQRRGDTRAASSRTLTLGGFSEWLAGRFSIPCPTAGAMQAQVWFNLKSGGLPVLAVGFGLAILIPLLLAVTTRLDVALSQSLRGAATRVVPVALAAIAVPAILLFGGNAFGIRTRQGRAYASAFDVTQACSTARAAALRVAVRTACLLIALVAVVTSIWTSASTIPFDVLDDGETFIQKSRSTASGAMRAIEGGILAMSPWEQLALALITVVLITVMVAIRAALPALRVRYPRQMKIATTMGLLYGFVLLALFQAEQNGIASTSLLYAAQDVTNWLIKAAGLVSMLATAYLFWAVLAEHLITPRQAAGVVLLSAVFGAAWVLVLAAVGVPLGTMPLTDAVPLVMWPALLPLMASALAPWSLSRVRHT